MLDLLGLPVFVGAALILLVTPGPAVLYIIARSVDQGRRAGLVSVLSIETGNLCHVLAAALGLSAILLSSALAFTVVKYLGAAYLVYLGLRRLLTRGQAYADAMVQHQSLRRIYSQGVLVAILNPKTALFFLAFLPQFVDASRGPVTVQLLMLGCLFVLMAVVTDGLYALLAGSVGQWLATGKSLTGKSATSKPPTSEPPTSGSPIAEGRRWFLVAERYVAGSVYVILGVMAALADVHLTHR